MHRGKAWASIVLAVTLLGGAAQARDWGDVLLEKGLVTPQELERTRKEIEESRPRERKNEAPVAAPSGQNPAKAGLSDMRKQVELSTLMYGDWAYYTHTGFGPQFLTQINPPGPGNDGFNSFDLTRTYLNFLWKPSRRFTLRVTPNIFREVSTSGTRSTSMGSSTATNVDGNLAFRLKYGFLQANDVLYDGQNFKIGQIENPLVAWEEDLYGYRFVNLVPLNYLAYSSTDLGIAMLGPVTIHGAKYADYWLGVYNGSSFHAAEFNEKRSPQGRVSLYPFAEVPSLAGFGVTGFFSYGYANVAPDTSDAVVKRVAGLVHYSGPRVGLAFEFDHTRNENSFNNFFSASGPNAKNADGSDNADYVFYNKQVLVPTASGRGFAAFGHVDIGDTPFSVFGMWHRWYPNTGLASDPLDFDRFVGGVAYRVNDWLRVAVDSQNLVYLHTAPHTPTDTHAFFTNIEINYK